MFQSIVTPYAENEGERQWNIGDAGLLPDYRDCDYRRPACFCMLG